MKKIFRMALVFALAGATLMYTGCTKDYSEDINKLDGEISSLEGKYQDLLNQLADAKSSLEAAYKAADKELEGNFDKKIAEINAAIAKKADAAAIEAEMDQLKKDLMAEADKLQKSAESLKKEVQDLLDDFYAAVSGELRALVVIPDFYFAGVEATSYDFALIRSFIAEKNTADVKSGNFKFPKADKLRFVFDSLKNAKTGAVTYPNDYSLGQKGLVNYDINPSTYDVDDAEWSLNGMDRKYVFKGDSAKVWVPKFLGIEAKDGIAAVNFEIENPDLLFASVDSSIISNPAGGYTNVPVMQLIATLEEGKTVASDWVAITSGVDSIAHLAFTKASKDSTKFGEADFAAWKTDFYDYAVTAATDTASVFWAYNAGALDLAKITAIHVQNADGEIDEWSLEELNAKYPGFSYEFELVPYTIGANVTGEDYYGQIKGSEFTPCYVKSESGKPESIAIAKDSKEGTSAVGRMPVVLATLKDAEGLVVAAGYFKIQIVKDPVAPAEPDYFDIPSFGKFPFVCDSLEKGTTWHEFSYFVLEALGTDYAAFTKDYQFTGVYANEYNKTSKKDEFIKIDTDGLGITKYGNITYTKDATGTGINDAITWKIYPKGIGEGNSKEVFLQFQGPKTVYFKLTAEVAKAAGFDFGANKISNEWYDDINGEAKNTVRINVLVPSATTDDVTANFKRDLNRFYVGAKPGVELTADSDPIYKETPDSLLKTTSKFYFAAEQPAIDGKQLLINETADSLFVVTAVDKNGKVTDSSEVAVLDTLSGVIKYCWAKGDTPAKQLLNLWSYTETDQAKMLFANVLVKTAYGKCEIPAGEENFHVRFVRPLDVNFTAQDVAEESAVAGFNVLVAKFITGIVDWNHQNVIIDSLDNNKKPTGNFIENEIKGVNMYKYYKFDSLVVDIDAALRDNWKIGDEAALDTLKKVTPNAQLTVGTVDAKDVFTRGSNNIVISNFANLKNAAINYKNDNAVVEKFNIFIPVKIYYSWGTMDAVLEINVKPTSETSGK